jgi:hypothetical protein
MLEIDKRFTYTNITWSIYIVNMCKR